MWKYIFPWCANPSWLCPGLARRAGPNKEWIWRIPCDEAARDPPRARSRHPGHHWTHHQVPNSQVNALPILPDLHRACVLNTLMSAFNHGWAFPIFATSLSLKIPKKRTRNKTPRVFVPNLNLLILGEVVNISASGNLYYSWHIFTVGHSHKNKYVANCPLYWGYTNVDVWPKICNIFGNYFENNLFWWIRSFLILFQAKFSAKVIKPV